VKNPTISLSNLAADALAQAKSQPLIVTRVFSCTKAADRDRIDTSINDYLAHIQHTHEVLEIRTLLSSDSEFHCFVVMVISTKI
jgi:hypothetical protein